jgi:hypothetical protein
VCRIDSIMARTTVFTRTQRCGEGVVVALLPIQLYEVRVFLYG